MKGNNSKNPKLIGAQQLICTPLLPGIPEVIPSPVSAPRKEVASATPSLTECEFFWRHGTETDDTIDLDHPVMIFKNLRVIEGKPGEPSRLVRDDQDLDIFAAGRALFGTVPGAGDGAPNHRGDIGWVEGEAELKRQRDGEALRRAIVRDMQAELMGTVCDDRR